MTFLSRPTSGSICRVFTCNSLQSWRSCSRRARSDPTSGENSTAAAATSTSTRAAIAVFSFRRVSLKSGILWRTPLASAVHLGHVEGADIELHLVARRLPGRSGGLLQDVGLLETLRVFHSAHQFLRPF